MSRPYPVAPPQRQKIPVCETPIPTSIKKSVPFFNPREFWSWGANPVGSNCRQFDTIIEKPVPPPPLNVSTFAGSVPGDDDGISILASFAFPMGIAVDSHGNVFVADSGNHKIKKVDLSGFVTTVAGTGISGFTNGSNLSASFWNPTGIAIASNGTIYVADSLNNSIRMISGGSVTTLAGSSTAGLVDGTGTSARFNFPFDLTLDYSENLYIADTLNYCIRKCTSAGVVTKFAGTGFPGSRDGSNSGASGANFNNPTSVSWNPSTGLLYVTDTTNNAIRSIDSSNVTTLLRGYYAPVGGSFDSRNNYYFTEQGLNRIIKYSISGENTIFAGNGIEGYTDALDLSSEFAYPFKVCAVTPTLAYVADRENCVIRRISSLPTPQTAILTRKANISPYVYSGSNATLTYSIIGAGGGGGINVSAGGGGGAGAAFVNGQISSVNSGTLIDFVIGSGGIGGQWAPYVQPTNGTNTEITLLNSNIVSVGGAGAINGLSSQIGVGGNGADGAFGGGGGYGNVTLGSGGTGTVTSGKNAFTNRGGNGGGVGPGLGGGINVSGLGFGGGGGGHGGGNGVYLQSNAFFYGAGGGGVNASGAISVLEYINNAGNGADGVIAFVFTPI